MPRDHNVTGISVVAANKDGLHITLVTDQDGDRIKFSIEKQTALDLAQSICDAIAGLKTADPVAGVALYEATRATASLEKTLGALGVQEKFLLQVSGQGSTKVSLRLSPDKVDALLAELEMHSRNRRRKPVQ